MKIETQPLENHRLKLIVTAEQDEFEEMKQRAARKLAKKVKIPGFRPGKAPYPVIVRTIGEGAVAEEALELLVNDIYPKAIDEAGVQPYAAGSLENVPQLDPPVMEFVIPLAPTVKLGDYQTIRRPYELREITEENIDEVVNNLRERQAVLEPVERPAEEGDQVTVKLSANRLEVEEGEDPALIRERSMPVIIRPADNEDEVWPFPHFSRELIGLAAGEEKTVVYTYPEDYEYEQLQKKPAEYHLVIEDVKSRTLPETNDEFASSVGEYETMEQLREEIRQGLEQQAADAYHQDYDDNVLQSLVEMSEISYPHQMVDNEVDDLIHNLEHRLADQNMDMDLYLKTRGMDMDALRAELRTTAEVRLKKSLILAEISRAENIEISPDELQMETLNTLQSLSQSLPEKDAKQLSNRNVINNIISSVMADLMTRRSIERLRSISSGRREEELAAEAAKAEAEAQAPEPEAADEETEVNAPTAEMPEAAAAGSETVDEAPVETAQNIDDAGEEAPIEAENATEEE